MIHLKDKLLSKIKIVNECWEFTGARYPSGYGAFGPWYTSRRAHRISYEIFIGKIPKGMLVCHKCDNPPCVNPDHLFIGSNKDNVQDMIKKGRKANPFKKITHCPSGHEYSKENTYLNRNRRNCRKCHKDKSRKRYLENREFYIKKNSLYKKKRRLERLLLNK